VNKRLLLGIAIVILMALVASVVLSIKKGSSSLKIKKSGSASISSLVTQAKDLEVKGNLSEAKSIYERLINEFPNSSDVMNWQKKMEEINIRLLFSPALLPKSRLYEIKPGDTLDAIAKEFKTTVELIMRSNNLVDAKILPGRKIKVWTAPFNIVVDKSQNTLILKSDEEIVKAYIVSTGINNSTPTGDFKIVNKLANPTWFKAGAVVPPNSPDNILGSRWLGFNLSGYGIHGTTEPQDLGKQVTQGCIRMSNSDIEELYTIIPIGTEVTIVD
jgi:lipoprotein-anchoring transpeptidase ErfK/SrfK